MRRQAKELLVKPDKSQKKSKEKSNFDLKKFMKHVKGSENFLNNFSKWTKSEMKIPWNKIKEDMKNLKSEFIEFYKGENQTESELNPLIDQFWNENTAAVAELAMKSDLTKIEFVKNLVKIFFLENQKKLIENRDVFDKKLQDQEVEYQKRVEENNEYYQKKVQENTETAALIAEEARLKFEKKEKNFLKQYQILADELLTIKNFFKISEVEIQNSVKENKKKLEQFILIRKNSKNDFEEIMTDLSQSEKLIQKKNNLNYPELRENFIGKLKKIQKKQEDLSDLMNNISKNLEESNDLSKKDYQIMISKISEKSKKIEKILEKSVNKFESKMKNLILGGLGMPLKLKRSQNLVSKSNQTIIIEEEEKPKVTKKSFEKKLKKLQLLKNLLLKKKRGRKVEKFDMDLDPMNSGLNVKLNIFKAKNWKNFGEDMTDSG